MKKINLKKVNKNTLCNVLIAVNVGTLVLNIINSKKKKKVATKEDIDDVCDYINNVCECNNIIVNDKIERSQRDVFKYVDSKLDKNVKDASTYIDDVLKLHSMDIKNTIEDKFDNLSAVTNPMGVKKPQ